MGLLNSFRVKPRESLLEEVLDSLTHILNTKQSFGAWEKDLGIEDFSGMNQSKKEIKKLGDTILSNIKKYERRLNVKSLQVSKFKSFSDFAFELEGELEGTERIFDIKISKKHGINVMLRSNLAES